jgi:hypothetical protein
MAKGRPGGEAMNSWIAWAAFALTALMLGIVGYKFSLRALRVFAGLLTLATAIYITWYGLTHPARAPGSLSQAFTRGADALSAALFHPLPLPPGYRIPGPGRTGWVIITVLLVIGYRELEAWTLRGQARSLDTSALADDRQDIQDGAPADGKDSVTDEQRHDRLAAELKFRLPAVEVRLPAILPGGSRSSGLASIVEDSGVTGSGLAGAVIRFFGMLWPSPGRVQVRIWVERTPGQAGIDDITRVTVDLEDPKTGASIATKTLAASTLDAAASVVAGYVARHIFAADPTAPPWCTGAADGRDLAAMLLARQVRVYPESEHEVHHARHAQIQILESVAGTSVCAGVARYELAQLYDLAGRHVEALLLHAINRERYPRFYRGRYRLAMSLEMIANPDSGKKIHPADVAKVYEALKILHRCGTARACEIEAARTGEERVELPAELRSDLLDAAWQELHAIRRYLMLGHVVWESFWHRDERAILRPYWRLRHRQGFHDGVCVALLLVAVRQALNDKEQTSRPDPARRPYRVRMIMRIATAIAGDTSAIAAALNISPRRPGKAPGRDAQPVTRSLRTRRWPWQYSTRSWQAAYNLACTYAAIAHDSRRELQASQLRDGSARSRQLEAELHGLACKVVTSLEFAIGNPDCEMERPWEWIAHDPDFGCLRSPEDEFATEFRMFLSAQKRRDYPFISRSQV